MSERSVLFGTQLYPATGDAARRQTRAAASLLATSPLRPVNLQFRDRRDFYEVEGFDTRAVLELDSNGLTRQSGPRKPVVSEIFTSLAELAREQQFRYFGFANADIVFTPALWDRIHRADRPAFAIARTEIQSDGTHAREPLLYGVDVFVIDARWWLDHRERFRPYILGEAAWDNVYAAQLLCHANALLLNREALALHETHPVLWHESPFAQHNGYLAALDRMYFTRWATYANRLERMRRDAQGLAPARDELQLQADVFANWRPGLFDRIVHRLRVIKLEGRRTFQSLQRS